MTIKTTGMTAAAWLLAIATAAAAPAPDSRRMGRAKDFIADEQWSRAIAELQAAAVDPKETNKDEALFWLAHSQHQVGDDASALQSIATLERTAPKSPWLKPAGSLRIEIAQRLRRDDVLWMMVAPPPAPPAPVQPAAQPAPPSRFGTPARSIPPAPPTATPPPPGVAPAAVPPTPPVPPTPAPAMIRVRPVQRGTPPVPPALPEGWFPTTWSTFDMTMRVQALSSLVESHSDRAIPLLREIALDRNSPDEARQAVFVLAQSRRPEAQKTVVQVAREGAEPVRIAAVRELGRFDGPLISSELMQVYTMSNTPSRLKLQVVSSLGERADNVSLLHIVKSEPEPTVRDSAIVTLGRTGSRDQLRALYVQMPRASKPAVLMALFTAKDDDELIRIAQTERDPGLRARARQQLRLLATPKAVKYLEDHP